MNANGTPLRILHVEDSEDDAELILLELKKGDFTMQYRRVDSEAAFKKALEDQEWDVILADYSLPGFSGLGALEIVKSRGIDTPFIIVSGTIGEEVAVSAMKAGAHDYLMKDNLSRLVPAVTREIRECELRKSHRKIQEELRQSEERLRLSQKLEAVGRLAGGIAHDFNNLLTAIGGYTDLTLAGLDPSNPLRANLEIVHASVEKAAALTRQILAFSRKQVMAPRVLDPNAVVGETHKLLLPLIREDIEIRIEAEENIASIMADPGQIQQVIMNLVLNARDAMPQGGALTIRTCNVEKRESLTGVGEPLAPGRYVMLAVSDTGVGMDAQVKDRIFEPFFTTKEAGRGTGLGLATVYGIVSQCRGQIQVDSEPGKGSVFKVYLPALDSEEEPQQAERKAKTTRTVRGKGTILVAENDDAVRGLLQHVLHGNGYLIWEAKDGEEAFRVSGELARIDLLLTDVVMPGMSGVELSHRILQKFPELKIVYMSGYAAGEISTDVILGEGSYFLQKPFTSTLLLSEVARVLGSTSIDFQS